MKTNLTYQCNKSRSTLAATVIFFLLSVLPYQMQAQWSTNPAVNNAISTASGYRQSQKIVSDGSGGAIITWQDLRSGSNYDIYAQRINASGAVQWTANGVAICTASDGQSNPTIISDGSGGAIITWYDFRSGSSDDIYAQRINASGAVQWTANGVAICTASDNQSNPTIISDGSGGAIITWQDFRSGSGYDIYAQRINASGAVQWTADGVALCTASNSQIIPTIVADGSGGAIITWQDFRSGSNIDIYAQRINASGTVQWTANGVAICTASDHQFNPTIISDGSGGAIITWYDFRSGSGYDIYTQRINASGAVQWTANGVDICTASNNQFNPTIVSDGSGGAIITWHDLRPGTNYDIYAQRINASGAVQWTTDGVAICSASDNQQYPNIVSDGSGGAITTWQDRRGGGSNDDIYAQRINASGAVQWTANGVAICTASNYQQYPNIVSDGSGGAIITWIDFRSGSDYDIYAQKVNSDSTLGNASAPEINLKGNSVSIPDGDATPSSSDFTDFGSTPVCSGTVTRTFTIENTGTSVLTISSVNISGTNAGDFSLSSSPSSTVSAAGSTTFQITFDPSASSARNATITVNNDDGDEAAYDFAITGIGTNLVISAISQTNVPCNGGSNGAAAVDNATGGGGAYTYDWTPGNPTGDGTTSVTGLTAGSWTCTVTDANSCTATQTFTVTQPSALSVTANTQTNVACNGGSTGAASVNSPSGGAGAYTYNWTPGNPTGDGTTSVTGLTAGSWTCTVTDFNSCTATQTFTVTQPSALSVTANSQTNVACNGGSTGAASVNSPSGGAGAYTYDWTPGNPTGDGTTSVTGLTAGSWTCTVTDANSCTATQTFTVTQPSALSVTANTQTNVACNGGSTGAASVNSPSGGAGAYTYNWTPGNPTGDGTTSVTGLTAGSWTCTVTDANSCTTTQTFNITQPPALVVTPVSQTNVSCNGGSNGAASVSVSGGTTSYSYNWTPGNPTGDGTASVTGLTAQTYTCTVTDANSCTATQTFTVTQPSALSVTANSQTNVSCNGGSNGAASVSVSGGTTSYSYNWTPGNPTGDGTVSVTGLTAGSWTCTVTDANSCTATQTFTVTQPSALSVTANSQTNVACNGGSTGAASVNSPSGGAGSYTYNWTPGNPTGDGTTSVTGLTAGSWTCTVTDFNSCTATQTFNITQPTAISLTAASQTNVACIGYSTGAASVNTATGGTGSFTYDWTPGTPSGDGTTSITGLTAGTYTCNVTDANSCTATQSFNITQPSTEAEINVTGNSITIADGDNTPGVADHTDFGNQNINGGSMVRTFTVENTGTANLNISGVAISGTAASDYSITTSPSSPVAASGSTTFQVTFDPSANGARDATITISTNDCDEGSYNFDITGVGSAQEINIQGNSVSIADGDASPSLGDHTSFGDLAPSASLTRTYTIQNTGTARLDISNIALSGTDASLFTISGFTLPDTITPGDSKTFNVSFTPTSGGLKNATVTISNNDANEASYDFAIQGERNCYTNSILAIQPAGSANTGGVAANLYLGYGAQIDTLKAIGFGANVSWSPTTNLSCNSACSTTVFSPSAAGTYTFTASNGCISKSFTVCVSAVSAGGTGTRAKAYICHKEPVTNVTQTLAVLLRGIPSHFQYHSGDKMGSCSGGGGSSCTSGKRDFDYADLVIDEQYLEVVCSPNPFHSSFKLNYTSNSDAEATIVVYGMTGNLLEKITLSGFVNETELGGDLPDGIYTIAFIQGDKNRVFKMIKID